MKIKDKSNQLEQNTLIVTCSFTPSQPGQLYQGDTLTVEFQMNLYLTCCLWTGFA